MFNKMPEVMLDKMPEGMPARMSSDMPDRMLQGIPDKVQNVCLIEYHKICQIEWQMGMPEDCHIDWQKLPEDMQDYCQTNGLRDKECQKISQILNFSKPETLVFFIFDLIHDSSWICMTTLIQNSN